MLLAKGVDVEARGAALHKSTPLQLASHGGSKKSVQMLLAHGADVNALPGRYGSAMMAATTGDHQEIIQILQAKGARLREAEREALSSVLMYPVSN